MGLRLTLEEQKQLSKEACKGDKRAQDKIYTAYHKAVFGYIRGRSAQEVDAENISQQVWMQVLANKGICNYKSALGALYTFLWRIAHSRLIDYYRQYKKFYWVQIIENEVPDEEGIQDDSSGKNEDCIDLSLIADSQIDPEEELNSAYKIVLEQLFRNGGYPHQIIVFAFSKLIDHWKPQKIIKELSGIPLRQLCKRLYQDYLAESNLPEEEIISCFSYLEQSMERSVGEIITDPASRDKLKSYLDKSIGDTLLKDYFGKDTSHSISDWCDKVKKRLARGREEMIS